MLRRWMSFSMMVLALVGASAARAEDLAPDELIKRMSTDVLGSIQNDKSLQDGNLDRVAKLVDEKVLPNTDFQRMTASAVGAGWRQATPDQRAQLTEQFKQLLLRTYAGAFSQAKNVKLEFKPLRASPDDTEVTVRSQVLQPQGDPIQLDYRMAKEPNGWKIIDVNVLGVWLVQTYRTSFAQEINRGGVDGLVKSLQQKNAELATTKK